MSITITDFRNECDTRWGNNQETYSREEVMSLLWSQIAILYNDINDTIYSHMRKQTIEQGQNMRNWNEEERDIMDILKEPRCVQF